MITKPENLDHDPHTAWPVPPVDKDVVLHTRVVTESGGGPDKTILLSASFLADTNYWLAAAYMHPPDDAGFDAIRHRAAEYQCPLISVSDRGPTDRSVVRTLLDICRSYNVRIWHGHDYKSNLLGLTLRPFHPMKLVTTLHGWVKHTLRTPLYYAVDRVCLPYYDHVICVSEDLRGRALNLGVPPECCSLIRNAIDEKTFSRAFPATGSPLRARTPPGRLVVGALGRLSPEKGFADLIRATHLLVNQGRDIELWIAGEGSQRRQLESLIDHLGLADRVKLLGFRADTIGLYHAMDLYVLSSLREGLPNVVLEAMAMGVAVVATRVAGVPNLISHGETGLLCAAGRVDLLADAMRQAVDHNDLRQRLAAAARRTIEHEFSFTRRMAKVRAIYDRLLDREEAAAPGSRRIVSTAAPGMAS